MHGVHTSSLSLKISVKATICLVTPIATLVCLAEYRLNMLANNYSFVRWYSRVVWTAGQSNILESPGFKHRSLSNAVGNGKLFASVVWHSFLTLFEYFKNRRLLTLFIVIAGLATLITSTHRSINNVRCTFFDFITEDISVGEHLPYNSDCHVSLFGRILIKYACK